MQNSAGLQNFKQRLVGAETKLCFALQKQRESVGNAYYRARGWRNRFDDAPIFHVWSPVGLYINARRTFWFFAGALAAYYVGWYGIWFLAVGLVFLYGLFEARILWEDTQYREYREFLRSMANGSLRQYRSLRVETFVTRSDLRAVRSLIERHGVPEKKFEDRVQVLAPRERPVLIAVSN